MYIRTNFTKQHYFIMKKRLLTVLLFTFGLLISNAQDQGDFELGINAGLNLSNLASSDDDFESDSRVSFNIAASGEYYFSDRWGIKTKLIFDKKGFGDDDNDVDVNMDYITIPVMANWHFGSNRNWYLNFGVYGGFLLNA